MSGLKVFLRYRARGGDLPAFNLLTPVVACLDPRKRSPVINSREEVRNLLRRLGLANGRLVEQFRGLVDLLNDARLNQAGIDDAFSLDTAPDAAIDQALAQGIGSAARVAPRPAPLSPSSQPLALRDDEDVEVLRTALTEVHRQRHNAMTNALRAICKAEGLSIVEGTDRACRFDALVVGYLGTERDLLIEVKTASEPAFCRIAVGQLLDYRRHLPRRAATDLAVLFPEPPDPAARAFLGDIGVRVLWLVEQEAVIEGDVQLGRKAWAGVR